MYKCLQQGTTVKGGCVAYSRVNADVINMLLGFTKTVATFGANAA